MSVPKRSNRISRRGAAVMCSPIRAGFMALRSGYVDTIDGKPSFTDWTGEQSPIAGSLLGWVDCWQRFNTGLDFTAHLVLHKKLTDDVGHAPQRVAECCDGHQVIASVVFGHIDLFSITVTIRNR